MDKINRFIQLYQRAHGMKTLRHHSAKALLYNNRAKNYDEFNEKNSVLTNQVIENILEKHQIKAVLDLTCGTGSQVFWLANRGYSITGSDINIEMIKIAKDKAKKLKLDAQFVKGDMRTLQIGKFDAVITIFNSIGHLTKNDFETAMQNIHKNLNESGLYLFDIYNLNYLLHADHITHLTIDWEKSIGDTRIRKIQYSTINENGVLTFYTTYYEKKKTDKIKILKDAQTLQVYTASQLKAMLHRNGFVVIDQYGIDGSKFSEKETERILTIAKKQ